MNVDIGRNIKKIRESRGLDQKELAKFAGIAAPTICLYEQNKKTPSLGVAIRMANVLRCSMDELCGRPKIISRNSRN